MSYCIDLDPFFESSAIRPVIQNTIVKFGQSLFKVERWFMGTDHCYVFIDEKKEYKPFAKKPSEVKELISEKKLTIEKP